MRVTSHVLGEVGEFVVARRLESQGYRLIQFDKAMFKRNSPDNVHTRYPVMPDIGLGHSYGQFGVHNSHGRFASSWENGTLPSWCDFSPELIMDLAGMCRKSSICFMRDNTPDQVPCSQIEKFLDQEFLFQIYPKCFNRKCYDSDGMQNEMTGYNVLDICFAQLSKYAIHDTTLSMAPNERFIKYNMLVSDYIDRCWLKFTEDSPLPHDSIEIHRVERKQGVAAAEDLKNANREHLKRFPGTGSHPGRYDFIAEKDGTLYAVEVKVNNSMLNYWQTIRLGLLESFSCEVIVAKVKLSTKQAIEVNETQCIESIEVEYSNTIECKSIDLPSEKEIFDVLNFRARHEMSWRKA